MNPEKFKKLQAQICIGGKGTPRRKKKVTRSVKAARENKLQASLQKLSLDNLGEIQEANIFKDDGTVIGFKNPKVQAETAGNVIVITGHAEIKSYAESRPGVSTELGSEGIEGLADRMENVVIDANDEETSSKDGAAVEKIIIDKRK